MVIGPWALTTVGAATAAPAIAALLKNLRRVEAADSLLLGILSSSLGSLPREHFSPGLIPRHFGPDQATFLYNRTGCGDQTQYWAVLWVSLANTFEGPLICPFATESAQNSSIWRGLGHK
jgi:hypothetical protein